MEKLINLGSTNIMLMNSTDLKNNFNVFYKLFAENTRGHVLDQFIDDEYILFKAKQLYDYLDAGNSFLFGLFIQETLCGFLWTYKRIFLEEERFYINSLIISRNHRGKGFGKLLISELERFAISKGVHVLDVSTAAFKFDAIGFYQKLGYQPERIQLRKAIKK